MSGIRDTATVTLNVNGAQAKQMMSELEQKVSDTKKKISDLKASMADAKEIEKARKELKSYEKQLGEIKSATEGVNSALSNLDSATPRQLEKALKTLKKQLKDMPPGSETWDSHIEKIKELKERLAEIKDETREQESLWEKFMDWSVGAWPALDLLGQWGNGLVDVARSAVDAYAGMDQEMANVRKFTGMTEEQVNELNEAFKSIDTRTGREDLNKLAQEAGRLGKTSSEDILGFVRAADKINVALDDLGEGATLTLSKLTGIFGDEKIYGTEQSLLKVGSVINELSQNCSASAPYLAEFASRMGGVGAQAGMTIQQIMGFAAVLDSNEQKVEASSTALSQVIVRMMQEPAKYAKVAGLDVKKFTETLKKDANGALLMFLDTLQKAGGMDVLSPMFKDMGENGSRAISALSTLATHIDEVKAQQEAANVAFKEGTSIDKEFNVQNNTVQASLDKAKKAVNEIRVELGQRLQPVMAHVISSSSALLRAMATLVAFVFDNKASIIALTATIAAYTVAINLAAVKTKLHAMYMSAHAVATKAWSAAVSLSSKVIAPFRIAIAAATNSVEYFTNGLRVNYAMQLRWSKALASFKGGGWIGFVVAATAALALLAKKFVENYNAAIEARRKQEALAKSLVDVSSKSKEYAEKEIFVLKKLYEQATDTAEAQDKRTSAAQRLIKMYPEILSGFSKEEIAAGKAKDAYDRLTESIMKNAEARAAADLLYENKKKMLQLQVERKQFSDQRKDASARRDEIRERNRRINARASESAESLTGALAMQAGGSQSLYQQESTIAVDKEVVEATEKMNEKAREINTYAAAVNYIWNQYKDNSQFVDHLVSVESEGSEAPSVSYGGKGYTSQVQAEKDRKKAEAAARAAAVKARKEFKEQLDQIKAARDKEQTEIMALRMMGEINYLEYNKRKLAADEKYYDDSIALYEKWGIQEDDQCQALARKREEFLSKANQQRLALNKEAIQRVAQAEERDLKALYAYKSSHTLAEELRLEEELLTIRYNALMDQQALYKKTDKEYEDYQRQIDVLFLKDQEEKQKKLLAKIAEFSKKFDYQSTHEKYDMERAAVEELYKLKMITEEKYRRWLKGLDEQEAEEKKNGTLPGNAPDSAKSNAQSAQKKYDSEKGKLDDALAVGDIDESEYQERLGRLNANLRDALIAPLKECKSEWVSMVTTMVDSWADFADALKDPEGDPFGAMSSAIQATAAVATSVMSMVTEFQKAEYEIQAAEVQKRYDAEIEAAEGNSYRTRKLEKEREKELAKLKKEQSKKQFALQVIATIAQTAANAVQAYSAGLSIGGLAGLALAPIAAALAVAQGAVQIALIKKQQQAAAAQGYSKGGFTKRGGVNEPAGIVHAGEWVASQKLLANPVARPMIEALDYAQRTNTIGSLKDEDVSRSIRATDSMVRMAESDGSSALMVAAVVQNAEAMAALNERLKQPIDAAVSIAGEHGFVQAEYKYNRYLKNKSPKDF